MTDLKTLGKYYLLSSLRILSNLSSADKSYIAERASLRELKRHENLYLQGEPGQFFYIIVNGSVELYKTEKNDSQTEERSVGILRKGDFLGIISTFTDKPHIYSARGMGDVKILQIPKSDFLEMIERVPTLSQALNKVLTRRLNATPADSNYKIVETNVISVFSEENESLASQYAIELSDQIVQLTGKKAIVLRFNKRNREFSPNIAKIKSYHSENTSETIEIFSKYQNSYHYIILDIQEDDYDQTRTLLNKSDFCHVLTNPANFSQKDFLLKYDLEKELNSDYLKVFNLLNFIEKKSFQKNVTKISRDVTGMRIGLALGGGAAFGLAQIGVLKVLEKENIPIDIISGTSIGSLVGALWASGIPALEIEEATESFHSLFDILKLVDLSLIPRKGLISGNNIRKFLEGYIGNKSFEEMERELRIITCDINRREEVILKEGSVVNAIMASTAIPGLFNPFITENGTVYVDGGVVNPLPVSSLTIEGVQRIISVNAMPSPEDSVRSNKINQSIMDIFINSFYSLQYRLCKYSFQSSDVFMSPILPNSSWYEFHRAKDFIQLGERVCEENISAIKELAYKEEIFKV